MVKYMEFADQQAEQIKQQALDKMQEQLDRNAEELSVKYEQETAAYQDEYLKTLEEMAYNFQNEIFDKVAKIKELEKELFVYTCKQNAAIEAAKRKEELELELDKYKINVSELDLLEINRLREIAPYFRNPRAIYKIVWESYYRNLTTELINRVIGTDTKTGIYKITNTKDEKTYIGQAVDLSNRWKDHIKAGLGIDTPNNKLYAAMMEDGVENFTFEVIEICDRADLNDRETFWIAFYQSQDWGYNMTRGGARK